MGLRETMNNNPAAVTGGAAVLLLLALLWLGKGLVFGGGSDGGTQQIIYYDVANKQIKLVDYDSKTYPNSPLDGSPETYEAALLACGECPEDKIVDGMSLEDIKAAGMYVGWISRRDPGSDPEPDFNPSMQFRSLQSPKWVSASSEAGFKLQDQLQRKCPGKEHANQCYPSMK